MDLRMWQVGRFIPVCKPQWLYRMRFCFVSAQLVNSEPIFSSSARAQRPCSLHTSTRTEHAVSGLNEGSYPRIPPFRLIFLLQGSVILIETGLIIGRCVSADESPPSLLLAGHNCEENELFKSKQEALIYLQRNPPELCWRLRALPFSINKNSHANESPKKPRVQLYLLLSTLSIKCSLVSVRIELEPWYGNDARRWFGGGGCDLKEWRWSPTRPPAALQGGNLAAKSTGAPIGCCYWSTLTLQLN